MHEGLTSGWHLSRDGAAYGPYEWADLAVWARDGRLTPDDLVWRQGLPGWMPAGQVPGLFPGQSVDHGFVSAAPMRSSSRDRVWAVLLPVAALVLVGIAVGVLFATGAFSGNGSGHGRDKPGVVETPMRGPTVIDVPYESSASVVSPEGGRIEFQGAQIIVPEGAVGSDTGLEVRVLQGDFQLADEAAPAEGASSAGCVGPAIDFGPDGTVFEFPVTVCVPYDTSLLPAGTSEDDIFLTYWDGLAWVRLPGTVNTESNVVTVELTEFNGIALRDCVPTIGIAALPLVYVYETVTDPEHVWSDPISRGEASAWVKPTPIVRDHASRAVLYDQGNKETKSLTDPDLAAWLEVKAKEEIAPVLAYIDQAGNVQKPTYQKRPPRSDWQLPDTYFTRGVTKPLTGDCADVACSAVAVFLVKGFPAVGVYGYVKAGQPEAGATHQWAEVLIGDKKYFVDEYGGLRSFSQNPGDTYLQRYEPATDRAHRNCMFNDKKQEPYDPDWYKQYLTFTTTTTGGTFSWVGTEWWGGQKYADIKVEFALPADGSLASVRYTGKNTDGGALDSSYTAWQEKDGTIYIDYMGIIICGKPDAAGTLKIQTTGDSAAKLGTTITWELKKQ